MAMIQNAWYAGGWSLELDSGPVGRILLNRPIVFFRLDDGGVAALSDMCPHRAVPLHMGRVENNQIVCPYHGLRFDGDGMCRHNPHVKGPSDRIGVRAFSAVERYGIIWFWPGDRAAANPDEIPDYSWFDTPDRYAVGRGYTCVKADYRLIIDNLLDLSHAEYVHPNTVGTAGATEFLQHQIKKDGNTVTSSYFLPDMPPSAVFAGVWTKSERIDQYSDMTWRTAGNLLLDLSVAVPGADRSEGWHLPSAHLLTPEDDRNTHYFWAFARDFAIDDQEVTDGIVAMGEIAFGTEDKPMIESAQMMIDRMGHKLLNFSGGDSASVQVRRLLDKAAAAEASADSQQSSADVSALATA